MRLFACPCLFVVLVLSVSADAQLLAPLMSLAGGLASNLNPFQGITSGLTGGLGGGGGLRGGLLSSLRGAASSGVGFSALPGGVRNMPLVPAPGAAPSLPPFAGFGSSSNLHYGQQLPMLSPEELAEIMHSQSQSSPAEFDAFGNPAGQPQSPAKQPHRGFNNQPPPQPQPQHQPSSPPAYSQPQANSNFRPPQNSHQANRDNEYNGNSSEDDGNEDDHRPNDDSDSGDYGAARPPVRRPPAAGPQTNQNNNNNNNYNNNNNNNHNNRYRAPPSNDYDGPVGDRDRDRDYNQFDGPLPARGNRNYRGPRNENAPVVRGYRVRSPSPDERDNYNRPAANSRPEQGNRYLQGGFTPVSAAGGFDGPPDRHVPPSHVNTAVRQNTRHQSGRASQHYYNSMHDQRPRDDRDSAEDVDDERESYGRSPSEQRPQAAYGYYNKDEYAGSSDEGDDDERRRRRRNNSSRY